MIEVYIAADLADAQLVCNMLEDHGIKAVVQGELLNIAQGGVPCGPTTAPTVWVNEVDAEKARRLIDEVEQRRRRRRETDASNDVDSN